MALSVDLTCQHCGTTFDDAKSLVSHGKQKHSTHLTVTFKCRPDNKICIYRKDGEFMCPGCGRKMESYTNMYNHCTRLSATDKAHAEALDRHILEASGKGANPAVQSEHKRNYENSQAVRSEYEQTYENSQGPGANDVDDMNIDLAAYNSPYKPTPFSTPKRIPGSDDGIDVAMQAPETPDSLSRFSAAKKQKGRALPAGPSQSSPSHEPFRIAGFEDGVDVAMQAPETPDAIPRITAAQKRKGRAPPSPSQPPYHEPSPFASQVTLPLPPAGQEMVAQPTEFLSLPVPYGSPDILTSSILNALNCVISLPLRILVCLVCKIGVHPRYIKRHRGNHVHQVPGTVTDAVVTYLIQDMEVPESDMVDDELVPFPAVPGIPFRAGLQCPLQGCNHCRASRRNIGEHIRSHGVSIKDNEPITCTVQAVFESNNTFYRVVVPIIPEVAQAPPDWGDMMESRYHAIISGINSFVLLDSAHLSPFLAKYKWHEAVANLDPGNISRWVSPPTDEEGSLAGLTPAITAYFNGIIVHMESGQSWTTVLRYINTPKMPLNNRPFRVPMREKTVVRYVGRMLCFVAFMLRIQQNEVRAPELLKLFPASANAANRLLHDLSANSDQTLVSVHTLLVSVLREPRADPFQGSLSPFTLFFIFNNTTSSGMIKHPEDISGTISEMKWPLRAAGFYQIVIELQERFAENAGTEMGGDSDTLKIVREVHQYLREDGFTNFSWLSELSHFVTHLCRNSVRMPRMMWQDDSDQELMFDGRLLTMPDFRSMFNNLVSSTTSLLLNEVLMGLPLPDLHQERIYDELSNTAAGYSFLTDRRNSFYEHSQFLIRAMISTGTSRNRFVYQAHSNASGLVWNMRGLALWLKLVERCLGQMFACCHYGAGQPGRGTEMSILTWVNSQLHPRNCYWFDGLLNFVSLYNKTQTNMETQRLISRGLEPRTGELFIKWATFVVPALVLIADTIKATESNEAACRMHTFIFTSMDGEWDTDDFSSILGAVSGQPVSQGGLGHAMGFADTRHFLIGIMKKRFRGMVDQYGFAEELFNEQSGHGTDVAMRYALDAASIQNFPEERLHNFNKLSRLQHHLVSDLSVEPAPALPTLSLPQQVPTGQVQTATTEYTLNVLRELAPRFALELATHLAPKIHTQIAGGFAAITPIHGSTSQSEQPSTESGLELIDVNQVELSSDRYSELRRLYGVGAVFRSKAQAAMVELVMLRNSDLMAVLPTAGGKSLAFLAPAVNKKETEARMITVIVVPLNALLTDLEKRLKEKNILYQIWTDTWDDHPGIDFRSLLVTTDNASNEKLVQYLMKLCKGERLARLILEEIQFVLTSEHYRPAFKLLKLMRQLAVPIICLSATVPLISVKTLCEKLWLLPEATKLIRASTVRENIVYTRLELVAPRVSGEKRYDFLDVDGKTQNLIEFLTTKVEALQPHERILGFVQSRDEAEALGKILQCEFYHGPLDRAARVKALKSWEGPGGSPILIATTALGAGVDCMVSLVFHYRSPRNHIDQSQESGRAGRDEKLAHHIVFWDPADYGPKLLVNQSNIGVKEQQKWLRTDQCLRLVTGEFLDGRANSCIDLATVVLCGFCSAQAFPTPAPKTRRLENIEAALSSVGDGNSSRTQSRRFDDIQSALSSMDQGEASNTHDTLKRKRNSNGDSQHLSTNRQFSAGNASTSSVATMSVPLAQSSYAGPSMNVEIAASRAQNEANRQMVQKAEERRMQKVTKTHLKHIQGCVRGKCTPCMLAGNEDDHRITACPGIAKGWTFADSPFKEWRHFFTGQLPPGHCFRCCMPQLFGLHANLSEATPCVNDEFLRRFAFAVWTIPEEQQAYMKHIGQQFTSSEEFARSLCSVNGEWINLVHLIVWVWDRITARGSTGRRELSLGSSSHHPGPTAAAQTEGLDPLVLQWCVKHNLSSPRDKELLGALGFSIGDDITNLTDVEWDKVGARPLEKRRLIAASEEDKKSAGIRK